MKIGIIGSNDRAVAIGRLLASGNDLTFSDPANPARAEAAAQRVGGATEITYKQAMTREVLIFATPRKEVDRDLSAMGAHADAVVVDATEGGGGNRRLTGPEMLARKIDDHRVVRALVVLPQEGANVPICGDDEHAKITVDHMFQQAGCLTTDRGPLSSARELEPHNASAA